MAPQNISYIRLSLQDWEAVELPTTQKQQQRQKEDTEKHGPNERTPQNLREKKLNGDKQSIWQWVQSNGHKGAHWTQDERSENFNQETENREYQTEVITELNILDGFNNKLDKAEQISELEDKAMKLSQTEKQNEKTIKKSEHTLRNHWDTK